MGVQRCPTGGHDGMERDGPAVASGRMTQRSGYAEGSMTNYPGNITSMCMANGSHGSVRQGRWMEP